jgi:mannosylglucosylglycerate synthase
VNFLCAADRFAYRRQTTSGGQKIYSIADAYSQAALVTYPSVIEGFGNAFLETIYYRRPIIMEAYEIFKCDIQPKGFKVIWFEDFMNRKIVEDVQNILCNHELAIEWTERNYQLRRRYLFLPDVGEETGHVIGTLYWQLVKFDTASFFYI